MVGSARHRRKRRFLVEEKRGRLNTRKGGKKSATVLEVFQSRTFALRGKPGLCGKGRGSAGGRRY